MANYNFPPTSRYYGVAIETITAADGEQTPYLARRFLPSSDRFALLREHVVGEGARIDLIAARELGDAEAWWRICDANEAVLPEALLVTGRRLRITLPEGIPGVPPG